MASGVGMEAGLAKKSGNADGVKASTVIRLPRANIHHTQWWENEWKVISCI